MKARHEDGGMRKSFCIEWFLVLLYKSVKKFKYFNAFV